MASIIPCLVCNTLGSGTDNHQSLSSTKSAYSEDKEKRILFLLRNLLEIPRPFEQCSKMNILRFVETCEQCEETIKEASLIYCEVRQLAQRFRDIQKKIVEVFKQCGGAGDDDNDPGVFAVKYYKKLLNDSDYNGFGLPFIIQDDNDDEGNGNEDDLNFREISEPCEEVVVKQEEHEEENIDKGYQEILLIFPSEKGKGDDKTCQTNSEVEEDDDEPVSQTDSDSPSDEEVDREKDSDYQCSELGSEEEEDDLEEQEGIIEEGSKYLLSFFTCKKCLDRFPTKQELDEHSNKFHLKKDENKLMEQKTTKRLKNKDHRFPKVGIRRRTGRPPKNPGQNQHRKKINEKRCNPDNPFPCPLCPCRLKKITNLKMHLKNCHPNNSISLDDPRLQFFPPPPSPTISEEPSLPDGRKSAKYSLCGPQRISAFELKYPHIICTKNCEGNWPCPWTDPSRCPIIFPHRYRLHEHITTKHLNLPLFTCNWPGCGKTFDTRHNYRGHYDEHRGTPNFKCEDCGLTFYRAKPLARHKLKMHLGGKFICEVCGMDFTCREYLNLHKTIKHKGTTEPPDMDNCQPQPKRGTGNKNVKDDDEDDKKSAGIVCELCGKLYKFQSTLKAHMEAVHEKVPGRYCCHLCDKRYRVITHLNIHLWEGHQVKVEGYKPRKKVARKDKLQCPVKGCRRLFLKKERLDKHGIEIHGEDGRKPGPFNCKYCGKNYFQRIKWQHCERTHENKESRPEKCEVCGKGFPTKDHLRFHKKYTHKMELTSNRGWRKGK